MISSHKERTIYTKDFYSHNLPREHMIISVAIFYQVDHWQSLKNLTMRNQQALSALFSLFCLIQFPDRVPFISNQTLSSTLLLQDQDF